MDEMEVIMTMGEELDLNDIGSKSLKPIWKTPNGQFFKSDSGSTTLPDISDWTGNSLLVNKDTYDMLLNTIGSLGEFLPINVENKPYYLFNCLNIIDDKLIDMSNSELATLNKQVVGTAKLAFHQDKISDDTLIFTTTFDRHSHLFCTEAFKTFIAENKFTGIGFDTRLAINPLEE